jgi:head-tail adaptor
VWAEKLDISDGERLRGEQVGASITTRFRVLYSPVYADLNAKDALLLEGRRYDIVGVKEIGRREGLEITATATTDGKP